MSQEKIVTLLQGTKRIIKHQRELERLKGENFNVFSILKMERRENETHSAFLKELLAPNGSHLKGRIFLELFLKILKVKTIDIESAKVKVEHDIGKVVLTKGEESGGRIDIFIWDKNNNCISIENKIDAVDQEAQIIRYCNYRKGKNKVCYLTKNGREASKKSRGELESGKDYQCISYKEHIQEWLKACLKEATEEPILRESIKQYLILIKKLTKSMDKNAEIELNNLMLKNFGEAEYIADHFNQAKQEIQEKLRKTIFSKLEGELGDNYLLIMGNSIDKNYAQIWIRLKEFPSGNMFFGLESFTGKGHFRGDLFIGILNQSGKPNTFTAANKPKISNLWVNPHMIRDKGENRISLADGERLSKLHFNEKYFTEMCEQIVIKVVSYVTKESPALIEYLKTR